MMLLLLRFFKVWILVLLPFAISTVSGQNFTRSSKRGLIHIPNAATPQDNNIWFQPGSDLTWYYNYNATPSAQFVSLPSVQFVPMLWGAPSSPDDNTFSTTVQNLISAGTNISYVLILNEPDSNFTTGGSQVSPELAASIWIREAEPLRKLGVKLGAPAVTGAQSGFQWLSDFFQACNGSCTPDFIPRHWYGDFQGMASNLGQVRAAYPNLTIWITEYALSGTDLSDTQAFFNQSADYFDRIDYLTRYSYFGSFRSDQSNVGPNPAMLNQNGQLTNIGAWYLGFGSTNLNPNSAILQSSISPLIWVICLGNILWLLL